MTVYSMNSSQKFSLSKERASAPVSVNGSVTVEAAMAVPLFFFAAICLLYLMEMMAIQTAVRSGLQYAGKNLATDAYPIPVVNVGKLEADVVNSIGADRLGRSIVEGGHVDCGGSFMSPLTGIGELKANYYIRIPVPIFGIPPMKCQEHLRVKAWTGYEKPGFDLKNDEIVYVTETGMVYHRDYNCSYLDLSIRPVSTGEVASLRNSSGGKYHTCEFCGNHPSNTSFITSYGDRYHTSLACTGLKRTVYAVPVSEVIGKGACSRCSR